MQWTDYQLHDRRQRQIAQSKLEAEEKERAAAFAKGLGVALASASGETKKRLDDKGGSSAKAYENIFEPILRILRPDVMYLVVSQANKGLPMFMQKYPNVIIMNAGGAGHIPIPLIKGELSYRPPFYREPAPNSNKRTNEGASVEAEANAPLHLKHMNIDVAFYGSVHHHKNRAYALNAMKNEIDHLNKYLPPLDTSNNEDPSESLHVPNNINYLQGSYPSPEWYNRVEDSAFVLTPRGFGRQSFRMAEVIQLGRIPIYLYDDHPWLPYAGTEIDYISRPLSEVPFSVKSEDVVDGDDLVALATDMSPQPYEYRSQSRTIPFSKSMPRIISLFERWLPLTKQQEFSRLHAQGENPSFSLLVQRHGIGRRLIKQLQDVFIEQRKYDRYVNNTANKDRAFDYAPMRMPTRLMSMLQHIHDIRYYWTFEGVMSQIDAFFLDPLNTRGTNGHRHDPASRHAHRRGLSSGGRAGNYLRCVLPEKHQDSSVLDVLLH